MAKKKIEEKPKRVFCVVGPQPDKLDEFKEEEKKPEQLFDFLNGFFSDKKGFLTKSNHERGKFYFMLNRFMSIKSPVNACVMSKIGINAGAAVSLWFYQMQNFTKTPSWMYISTAKAKQEKKKEFDVSGELIKFYCKIHELDMKTFNEAKERNPDILLKEVKELGLAYQGKIK